MRRAVVLGVLLAAGALSLTVAAYQTPPAPQPKVVEVEKLKDNLYMLKGGGGNTAVYIAANGVVVVDTKNPGWGQPILEKIKELTPKPVTTIINTHTHGDHVSGNVEFPAGIEIVVQENTRKHMENTAPVTGIQKEAPPNIFAANNGRGLPTKTFKDKTTVGSGNDRERWNRGRRCSDERCRRNSRCRDGTRSGWQLVQVVRGRAHRHGND